MVIFEVSVLQNWMSTWLLPLGNVQGARLGLVLVLGPWVVQSQILGNIGIQRQKHIPFTGPVAETVYEVRDTWDIIKAVLTS